jgi:hypothetical protein
MGYRSIVKSVIYDSNNKIQELKESAEYKNAVKHWEDDITEHHINDTETALMIQGDYFKWYAGVGGYDDVNSWHDLLNKANELGLSGEFMRIGEEDGDIEADRFGDNCHYYLHHIQSIECDFI